MPVWLYTDGHMGWALFACLVYTGLSVLVADYVWRRVIMRGGILLAAFLAAWLLGLLVLGSIL